MILFVKTKLIFFKPNYIILLQIIDSIEQMPEQNEFAVNTKIYSSELDLALYSDKINAHLQELGVGSSVDKSLVFVEDFFTRKLAGSRTNYNLQDRLDLKKESYSGYTRQTVAPRLSVLLAMVLAMPLPGKLGLAIEIIEASDSLNNYANEHGDFPRYDQMIELMAKD